MTYLPEHVGDSDQYKGGPSESQQISNQALSDLESTSD